MAAGQTADHDLVADIATRSDKRLVLEIGDGVQAAGATDAELLLVFGVEVEEDVAVQDAGLEGVRAAHAGLLVISDEDLDGAVLDALVLGHGHRQRDAQAVVGTERSALGRHPLAVDDGLDGVLEEIVHGVGGLLRDHVHMALKDDSLAVLVPGGGGNTHDHVAGLVGKCFDLVLLGPVEQILANNLLVLGRTGTAGQSVEIVPDNSWLKIFDSHSKLFNIVLNQTNRLWDQR